MFGNVYFDIDSTVSKYRSNCTFGTKIEAETFCAENMVQVRMSDPSAELFFRENTVSITSCDENFVKNCVKTFNDMLKDR